MSKPTSKELAYRILDANLNRATEGLRVCEEVVRFILNHRQLTARFKNIRHQISKISDLSLREKLIKKRDSKQDVGRLSVGNGLKRENYQSVFFANIQRVKESIRVLEEFYKLIDKDKVIKLNRIRYTVYELEKKVAVKISSVSGIRQRFLLPR